MTDSGPSFTKPYQCGDCGRTEGVHSQRRTWMEPAAARALRRLLPPRLLIGIHVGSDRPQHRDENTRDIHRDAA